MGDYTPKLAKTAQPVLEPGETLLAGVPAMSKGFTKGIAFGAAGSVVGGTAGMVAADTLTANDREEGLAAATSRARHRAASSHPMP